MRMSEEEYAALMERKGVKIEKPKRSKYNNVRTNGYDSAHEADIAADLHLREKAETLTVLEQVPFQLPGGIKYVADFVLLHPGGRYEVVDAKGMRTDVYKLERS